MVDELKIAGWGRAPADLSLGDDEVHVWRGTMRVPARQLDDVLRSLPRAERRAVERAERPKVAAARRAMLRSLLGRYLGEEPSRVRLTDGPGGREVLARPLSRPVHWDFAWGDTRAVFAISASQPLALHFEVVPRDLDVSHLMAQLPRREASLAEFLSPPNRARSVVGHHAEEQARQRLAAYLGDGGTPGAQVERLRLGKRFVAALAAQGWSWSASFWSFGEPDDDDSNDPAD